MSAQAPACSCITCGDQGVAMEVLELEPAASLARCRETTEVPIGPERESLVDVALVEPVVAGDVLLVHAGTALARLPTSAESRR